jgi:outer membrane protein OmpA-like peptidoglycan-associated protein
MNTLKTDITGVSNNVSQVASNVNTVSGKVDQTNSNLSSLDEKFQKRNNLSVATEKSVPFKFDSAALDPAHQPDLDEVADMLIKNPDAIIVLEGRTDATGNDEYNVQLGERRVESVRRYLAVTKNVPVYKIHEVSFGAAQPIADNESRDGREKNRSVKLTVLVPSMNASAAVRYITPGYR